MPSLTIRGAELVYEERGRGHAIVFLHGTVMDHTMFAPQLEALSDGFRVIAYDHRGRSTAGAQTPFTLDDLGEDLLGILDRLDIDKAVIGGMSMGGFTALRFAEKYPGRTAGLVLIDTAAAPHTAEMKAPIEGMVVFATANGIGPLVDPIAAELFGATTIREQPELVAAWQDKWQKLDVSAVANEVGSWLHRDDFTENLGRIEAPALIVHGAEDAALSPELGKTMAHELPNAEYVEIPKAGHSSNLEQPVPVNAAIRAFLNRVFAAPVAGRSSP